MLVKFSPVATALLVCFPLLTAQEPLRPDIEAQIETIDQQVWSNTPYKVGGLIVGCIAATATASIINCSEFPGSSECTYSTQTFYGTFAGSILVGGATTFYHCLKWHLGNRRKASIRSQNSVASYGSAG